MKILQKLSFSNRIRNIVIILLYTIFALYGIYMVITTDEVAGKACYAILSIVILSIALWAEYLRYLYYKAIKILNMGCNPEMAKAIFKDLLKKDFFKAYRKTEVIFNTLYTVDQNDPTSCLAILEQDEKFFRSSLDNLLIRNFNLFYSYFLLGNRSKTKALYHDVVKLKDAKVKGSKISPLYNWEYIDALYFLACKDYKKSLQAFKRCNTINMNQRELVHFYFQYARLGEEMQDETIRDENYDKVAHIKGNNAFILEARKLRGFDYENE